MIMIRDSSYFIWNKVCMGYQDSTFDNTRPIPILERISYEEAIVGSVTFNLFKIPCCFMFLNFRNCTIIIEAIRIMPLCQFDKFIFLYRESYIM